VIKHGTSPEMEALAGRQTQRLNPQ